MLLPDDAIPVGYLTVGVFLDEDGDQGWSLRTTGITTMEAIGYLELAKASLLGTQIDTINVTDQLDEYEIELGDDQ